MVGERPKHAEQAFDIGKGKRRGGLIEQQHAGILADRFGQFHGLLFGNREGRDGPAHIEVESHSGKRLARLDLHLVPVDYRAARLRQFAEEDVLRDGQGWHEAELLVDRVDACALRVTGLPELLKLPAEVDFTRIGSFST